MNDMVFTDGLEHLTKNFSTDKTQAVFTDDQKDILWKYFQAVTDETWKAMIRALVETQKWLPKTDAFFKAKEQIEAGDGIRERVRVECNLCDGEGVVAAIGKFSAVFVDTYYTRNYRCSCPNGVRNWSKQIAFRRDSTDEKVEDWLKQGQIGDAMESRKRLSVSVGDAGEKVALRDAQVGTDEDMDMDDIEDWPG